MIGYPRGFPAFLWTTLVACLLTGVLLVPGALELRLEMDLPVRLPGGYRIGVAAAHALSAFMAFALGGALYTLHIRSGWRRRVNLGTGFTTVGVLSVLAFTGLGIYYIADEALSKWISVSHIVVGAASVIAVAAHAINGRKLARSSKSAAFNRERA